MPWVGKITNHTLVIEGNMKRTCLSWSHHLTHNNYIPDIQRMSMAMTITVRHPRRCAFFIIGRCAKGLNSFLWWWKCWSPIACCTRVFLWIWAPTSWLSVATKVHCGIPPSGFRKNFSSRVAGSKHFDAYKVLGQRENSSRPQVLVDFSLYQYADWGSLLWPIARSC